MNYWPELTYLGSASMNGLVDARVNPAPYLDHDRGDEIPRTFEDP